MITLKTNLDKVEGTLKELAAGQTAFAISLAMRMALVDTKAGIQKEMVQGGIQGGPKPWTLNGMRSVKPTKDDLQAIMFFPENRRYMREIIFGGTKRAANKRLPEPILANIGRDLTSKGNISRRVFKQGNLIDGRAGGRYFIGVPKGFPDTPGNRGIWRRTGKGGYKKGQARGKITQIVNLGRPARQQRITFPADEIAIREFKLSVVRHWPFAMKRAIETARLDKYL